MARQSPNRPEADEPAADAITSADPVEATTDATEPEAAESSAADAVQPEAAQSKAAQSKTAQSEAAEAAVTTAGDRGIWDETRVMPVEIALPGGVGFTLRAYRLASEVTPTEIDLTTDEDPFDARARRASERAAEEDEEVVILDEEFAALVAEGDAEPGTKPGADADEPDPEDFKDEKDEQGADEEVPMFLSHRGRLLTFKSPESLVSFIRSGAPHDLAQLDTWAVLAERVKVADVAPRPEDSYELDLVVENLRGGHDTWDLDLLIAAGEIARDLGHALRLKPVILALSSGSPLDELDESLRSASGGGMGGFFGRRRLRKIGAQQASLGWRSIIGKISAAVDWRD